MPLLIQHFTPSRPHNCKVNNTCLTLFEDLLQSQKFSWNQEANPKPFYQSIASVFAFLDLTQPYFPILKGHHPTLGAHKKFTNYAFDVDVFLDMIKQAARKVRTNPWYIDAWQKKWGPQGNPKEKEELWSYCFNDRLQRNAWFNDAWQKRWGPGKSKEKEELWSSVFDNRQQRNESYAR